MFEPLISNNLEKIKRKNLLAISFTKLLHGFGTNIFSVIYQVFLLEITNSLVLTGIIISIGSIMQFLPMPLIGKLSDRYNRKILISFSMPVFMMGVFLFMIASPSTVYYAILGVLIYFLGMTINNLNSQFIVSESTSKSKGLMYSFMFFSFFLGSIGGSILLILNPYIYDNKLYFLLFIGILAIECILYSTLLSNKTQIKKVKSPIEKKELNLWKNIIKTKSLRSILIFFTLDIFVYGITLSIYNAGLVEFYGLNIEYLAIFSIGLNITNMLLQIPAGRITDKIGNNKKTLILSQIFGLGFFGMNIITILLWFNGITSTLLLTLLIGNISFACSIVTFIPTEQVILTNLSKERKAEYYGILNFARGVGYIPTGYIGGLMVEHIGYISPIIFSFVGVLIEIIFLLRFFHHHSTDI